MAPMPQLPEALMNLSLEARPRTRMRGPRSLGGRSDPKSPQEQICDRVEALVRGSLHREQNGIRKADFNTCLRNKDVRKNNETSLAVQLNEWEKSLEDGITQVRFEVNRLDESMGLGLISVRVIPTHTRQAKISAEQLQQQTVSPTLGFMPQLYSGYMGFVKVAFRPDVAEALRVTSEHFRGKIISANDLRDRAEDVLRATALNMLAPGDESLMADHGQLIVMEVPVYDVEKLRKTGLPFVETIPTGDPFPQAYFCRYPAKIKAAKD